MFQYPPGMNSPSIHACRRVRDISIESVSLLPCLIVCWAFKDYVSFILTIPPLT